jgi:hypothetical protein
MHRFFLAAVAAAAAAFAPAAGGGRVHLLLPDLDQRAPDAVLIYPAEGTVRLAFASNVENIGPGPLLISASRPSRALPTMRADQLVQRQDGKFLRLRGVGDLRYNVSPTHSHWHLLPFEQYELRTLDGKQVGTAQKSGFCLTSDHRTKLRSAGHVGPRPNDNPYCGKNRPGALRVGEGIAVGYGDIYQPSREGQYVDVTNVPSGDYVLVHRVNVSRKLRETRYSNDAASARIRLVNGAGVTPAVTVLRRCDAGPRG